ncbi:unnamed protein product [Symbiodinium sp. KB8]|nr:unnamed protein product [Symbiodinium sp. KB8]
MNRTVWRVFVALLAFPAAGHASQSTCQCDGIADWDDPSFGRCDWWGDVHITKSWNSPEVFDFQSLGVYSYASTTKCGGDFEMQIFQCPYSKNGNAVAIGVAVKLNDGDVVIVANDTVTNPNDADVSTEKIENLKKGVNILSDDKCVRLNVNTKLIRRAPGLLHNGNLRIINEALTNEGICGAPSFGGEYVPPDSPDMLFPDAVFDDMCGYCKSQTGVSVPGCDSGAPGGGGDEPETSPGCEFMQLRPKGRKVVDCAGDQDAVIEEAKADGENCVAYVGLGKSFSCSEFCAEKGSTCEMAIDQPNGQQCVASVSSLDQIDTSTVNCDSKQFRDLLCVCKKPDNPAPGPTPEEACAEAAAKDGFTLMDAAKLCRDAADWLKGVPYPPTGASGDAGEKEAFLRACILDVCSAEPEDRKDVAENAGDQDPSEPPVESLPDGNTRLSWSLTGLDPGCSRTCKNDNCCGVVIYEGTSCEEPAGSPLWDSGVSVRYTSSPSNVLSKEVKTGLANDDVLGRTVVIHDKKGRKIACGIIEPSTTTVFEKYPKYGGDLPLTSGGVQALILLAWCLCSVQVESDDETQTLSWLFTQGLDPRCDKTTCTAANCCGVHIHEGTTCSNAASVGGHYWNKDLYPEDPWMDVRYVIEGSMPSAVNDLSVTTGYNADDIDGRAVVVHDYDGVRIGCAIIEMPEEEPVPVDGDDLYVFDLSPYVGSSSPYQPQGVIEVKSTDDSKTAHASAGVLSSPSMSCAESAGPHYWDGDGEDPWLSVKYDSSTDPANVLFVEVDTGLGSSDLLGRTVVIHDKTGARIACGIIEESTTTVFEEYPNYGGDLPLTSGGVKVESDDEMQSLSWLFTQGLDPRCDKTTCTAANCCGVHIHEGTTCSDADAIGGHFWNKDLYPEDPWMDIRYVIEGSMPSKVNDLSVTTGFPAEKINGRAVVVHDYDGVRIGCATIKICVDSGSTVQGAIEKLEDAVDQIKDALSDLSAMVNSSHGKGGHSGYHSYGAYGADQGDDGKYKCSHICGDICGTQHPQPAHCQSQCKQRQNAILDIVQVYCIQGLCPSLLETNEEVGLLQRRTEREEQELEAEVGGRCREIPKYCQLFCKRGFLLPVGDGYDVIKKCREECEANFSAFQVPLQKYVEAGCCAA